jgi:hypothetical protein
MPSATSPSTFHFLRFWWAIGIALLLLLVYGSLAPPSALPPLGQNDKILHGLAYFSVMTWFGQMFPSLRTRYAVALGLILLGIVIEFIQPYVSRQFDWHDALVNAEGVALALVLSLTPLRGTLARIDRQLQRRGVESATVRTADKVATKR